MLVVVSMDSLLDSGDDGCSPRACVHAALAATSPDALYLCVVAADSATPPSEHAIAIPPAMRLAWLGTTARWVLPALKGQPPPDGDDDGGGGAGCTASADSLSLIATGVLNAITSSAKDGPHTVVIVGHALMALPLALREAAPHIDIASLLVFDAAFTSSESFAAIPDRASLLRGAVAADAIAFPLGTTESSQQFAASALSILGASTSTAGVRFASRETRFVTSHLGLSGAWEGGEIEFVGDTDAESARVALESGLRARHGRTSSAVLIHAALPSPLAQASAATTSTAQHSAADERPALCVSLMDEETSLPSRLAAVELFFTRHARFCGRVSFVFLVRANNAVADTTSLRTRVDELSGRVCGKFSTPTWEPLCLLRGAHTRSEVRAAFSSATVGLFCAAGTEALAFAAAAFSERTDAALVIGEFADARLHRGAFLCNASSPSSVCDAVAKALDASVDEREMRGRSLLARARFFSGKRWSTAALSATQTAAAANAAAKAAANNGACE